MQANEPTVSIIIPAYNAQAFVERAITSAQKQSHSNLEILVINDGSRDNTGEVVEVLCKKDPRIKLVNTENRGVSCARNTGLAYAAGEWVMFLDADDELFDDAVASMLDCAATHKLDVVAARYQSTREGEIVTRNDSENVSVYCGSEGVLRAIEDWPETYSACAKLFKKNAIKDVRFPEGRRVHEDSFFVFCCLAKKPNFGVYDKTVYRYFVTQGSASRGAFSEKLFDILTLAEEKRRIVEIQFPEYLEQSQLMLLKANMSLLRNLLKTREKKYREIENKCIKFVQQNSNCFKEAIPGEGKWFQIIKYGCYRPYKVWYRLKKGLRG